MANLRRNAALICLMVLLSLVLAATGYLCAPCNDYAYAAVNYSDIIHVVNDGETYKYYNMNNESVYAVAPSLADMFDTIGNAVGQGGAIKVSFDGVTTAEEISLTEHVYTLSGSITSTSVNYGKAVFTVGRRANVTIGGLVMYSNITAVRVDPEDGAYLTMNSGTIDVRSGRTNTLVYAVDVRGGATIRGDRIRYAGNGSTGAAIAALGSRAEVSIDPIYSLSIDGDNAAEFQGGNIIINGGTFQATKSAEINTYADSAVRSSSSANITVNGGTFESVSGEKTIYLTGNSSSDFIFNGGSVAGKLRIHAGEEIPSAALGDKRIVSAIGADIIISTSSSELSAYNAVVQAELGVGYHSAKWTQSELDATAPRNLSEFEESVITVVADNVYTVTFRLGDEVRQEALAYGTVAAIEDYSPECTPPLYIEGWLIDGATVGDTSITVSGANIVEAVLALTPPQIGTLTGVSRVYDATASVLAVAVAAYDTGATLSYQWEKIGYGVKSTDLTLSVTDVADSGAYRFKVTAEYLGYTASSSVEATVSITKATPEYNDEYSICATYRSGLRLTDLTLIEGYEWLNPNTLIYAGNEQSFEARYIPHDADNYMTVDLDITVDVAKATLSGEGLATIIFNGTYDVHKTLLDYNLPSDYYWRNAAEIPVCPKKTYEVYYNPDSNNYEDYNFSATINLSQAQAYCDNLYHSARYVKGMLLSQVPLPTGYTMTGENIGFITITDIGAFNNGEALGLSYNPDPANYISYTGAKLYLTIIRGIPSAPTVLPSFDIVYNPERKVGSYGFPSIAAPAYWKWTEDVKEVVPAAGEHIFTAYYNEDPYYYEDLAVDITFKVNKAMPDDYDHNYVVEEVYREGLALGDIELAEGYAWSSPDTRIYAGSAQEFEAVYMPEDTQNYSTVTITIKVTIEKATIDMSGFAFVDLATVYDGAPHSISYSGTLPNGIAVDRYEGNGKVAAGEYTVVLYLTQADTVNYIEVTLVYSAKLKIGKATPVFTGAAVREFVYDGQPKSAGVYVNNPEQTLTGSIPDSFIDVGVYDIVFSVSESDNYKAATYTVRVIIKKNSVTAVSGGVGVALTDSVNGFDNDNVLRVDVVGQTENELVISIALDVWTGTNVALTVTLPENYDINKLSAVKCGDIEAEFTIANFDNRQVVVMLGANGNVSFIFCEQNGYAPPAAREGLSHWAIALIVIFGALALAIITFAAILAICVIIKKKNGRNPVPALDKAVNIFYKNKSNILSKADEERNIDGAQDNPVDSATDIISAETSVNEMPETDDDKHNDTSDEDGAEDVVNPHEENME